MKAKLKEGRAFSGKKASIAAPDNDFRLHTRREFIAATSALLVAPAFAQDKLDAPNVVPISDLLVTAGQPAASALAGLSKHGFKSVIYLAPPSVDTAVKDEPALLARQNIAYHNIPIPFGAPEAKHFDAFVSAMRKFEKQKLLVHCEVNMRASCMTFLYRTLVLKERPDVAYEAVAKVWSPRFAWKPFLEAQLKAHGVVFEIY